MLTTTDSSSGTAVGGFSSSHLLENSSILGDAGNGGIFVASATATPTDGIFPGTQHSEASQLDKLSPQRVPLTIIETGSAASTPDKVTILLDHHLPCHVDSLHAIIAMILRFHSHLSPPA